MVFMKNSKELSLFCKELSYQQFGNDMKHEKIVRSLKISNDSKFIVSGSEDKSIKIWNVETMQLIHSFEKVH